MRARSMVFLLATPGLLVGPAFVQGFSELAGAAGDCTIVGTGRKIG